MSNKLQQILFNLSTFSPIVFFFCLVWWIQNGTDELGIGNGTINITLKSIVISVIGIIGLFYTFYPVFIVNKSCKTLERVAISVSSVISKDNSSVGAIITYIFPFSNLVFEEINLYVLLIIISIAILFLFRINTVLPNPILILLGYHFYQITTGNGSEELPLISKRKSIHDAKTIKKVVIAWDYFMIEVNQ